MCRDRATRARLLLLASLTLLASCAGSSAREAPAEAEAPVILGLDPATGEFGRTFLPLARRFGFSQFAYAARAARGGVLYEYYLPGETRDTWTRLGSLYMFRVGRSFEEAAEILPSYAAAMRNGIPEVHAAEHLPGSMGGVYFLHYHTGGGPIREEGLSAIWAILPGHLANFQAMNRSEPYTGEHIEYFKSIAAKLAEPREPTGPTPR